MGQKLPTAALQSFLNRHGAEPHLAVDDVLGAHTQTALTSFLEHLPLIPILSLGHLMAGDDFEGLDSPPDWPGGHSGVTIGLGYDLGYEPNFEADWQELLEPEAFARLQKVHGLQGVHAELEAKQLHDIQITAADAAKVFELSTAPRYQGLVTLLYPGSHLLGTEAQQALFSLVYNRGASLDGGDRIQMRQIRTYVASGDYVGIANELRAMISIWEGSLIEVDMRRRRTAESDLCLLSYFRSQLATGEGA